MISKASKNGAVKVAALSVVALSLCLYFAAGAADGSDSTIEKKIRAVLATKDLKGASFSVSVYDLTGDKKIFESFADKPLIPASNQKIITTAAVLDGLGKDHVFRTKLYATGPVGAGILRGDLVVQGSGDPNISGRFHEGEPEAVFKTWAETLKSMGVKEVWGNVIGDDRAFDRTYIHASWPDNQLHKWYCAPSGALTLNDSCLDVTVKPGPRAGSAAVCSISPGCPIYTLKNTCKTVSSRKKHSFVVTRKPGEREIIVSGGFLAGAAPYTTNVTVEDPGLFFVSTLKKVLEDSGIKVTGSARLAGADENPVENILVAEHSSTLAATLAVTNKRSQNLYADLLLKALGAKVHGKGSFETGARAVKAYMKKIGVEGDGFEVVDGSGMSRLNKVTTSAMVKGLRSAFKSPGCHVFWASLAVGGMDGTLERRFTRAEARGRVAAKSGYLSGVSSLSGFVVTPKGRYFAFSALFNNYKCATSRIKKIQESICGILLDHGDG